MRRPDNSNRRNAKRHRRKRRSVLLQPLESRLLFSGSPLPAFESPPDDLVESVDSSTALRHESTELIFVDRAIDNGAELANQLKEYGTNLSDENREFEIHFIETHENGLTRIAEVLNDRPNVSAIHLISHGDEAWLQLGNTTLTVDSMRTDHADDLEAIRNGLSGQTDPSGQADFLIYGCNFGRGADGLLAAQQLSELTGADVAASNDLTGSRELGADWELELLIGNVEAASLGSSSFAGTLAIEATDGIVTVQDAADSAAGTVSLSNNAAPTTVTTSGTPFRVAQMLERIWQYSETADVGESTFVFDINGIAGITGSVAAEFGIIVSDQSDLSGSNTVTLVASGYDAANGLIYFHGVDLQPGEYFGLATKVEPDNFSVFPTASGLEDTAIDLGLMLNPAITSGGTLRDIFDTDIGFRASTAGTTTTDFFIPAGTTSIKITGFSTRDIGTSATDARNDDYQSMNVSIDMLEETSNGYIWHIIDQGPARSDQFGWADAPLGSDVLTGGGTITGDADDNINPTFSIDNGVLKIAENHQLQTAYHVEFLTNATSSAEYISTASAVREDGDQANVSLAIPAAADFLIVNIADAATASSDAFVENKGNSRIYIDLDTLTASGTVAAQRGETDDYVVAYAFKEYDVSSAAVGSVLSNATFVGDIDETVGTLNDSQIYVDGAGNLVIDRENTFAGNFNSLITVEYYERRNVGSSAEKLGESTDYQFWDVDPADLPQTLEFDIPANAQLGIMNLSLNGTRSNDMNENMGAGFAVIDLVNGTSSGTWYMVRASSIVDFVAWDTTDFDTVFFQDPNTISNHASINNFNDKFAGNGEFRLTNGGTTLELTTHSPAGTQTFLDYYAGGQIEWFGSAPFELTGFPVGGSFSQGSLNTATGNWDLTIQEAIAGGLFFIPDEHVSGTTPIDISIIIGDEVDTSQVRIEAVIDPISFDVVYACDDEDTDIDISGLVAPTFVDQDGSETLTGITLSAVPIGHTVSDGTNTFVSSAGSQSVNITGWNHATLIYRANPNESGTYTITMDVDWQDVGGGVTDTDSMTTTFDVEVKPVNDPPVAVDDFYSVLGNTTLNVNAASGTLNNDSDIELDPLSASGALTGPSNGSVTLNANGSFVYTPATGFFGTDSFTYQVSDGNGGTDIATVYIDVSEPVTGPLDAIDDFETTNEETLINIVVMANDALPLTGAYNIQSTTAPSNGSITVLPDGSINYTPNADFFGVDTFTYTLADASGRTDTATVTVTVNNVQDPPVANADSGSTPEDTTLPNINILSNDSDPDGDTLTVTTATAPNGTVVINPDGTINYTPNENYTGTDTVTYTISDGNGGTDTSTVLINIVPVADPPTSADNTVCFDEDTEYVFSAADFAFADGDPGDMLTTIRIDSLPGAGDLLLSGTAVTVGQVVSLADINASRLVFRPAADSFGATYATFEFSVSDGALFQVTPNTMTLCVDNVQDPPVATDNAITVAEESTGTLLGLATPTDLDGDTLTATVTGLPNFGTVFLADGVTPVTNGQTLTMAQLTGLVYDAPADYDGSDPGDFTYDVTDGIDTDSGVVDITITAVNDPPEICLDVHDNAVQTFIDDRPGFSASLVSNSSSTIIDDGGSFASDPLAGSVSVVSRTGSIGSDAFSYSVYDIDFSNAPPGTITPGVVGGDINDLDDVSVELPASQGSAIGSGSWGVDTVTGQTSTRNALLFDFTNTPGGLGIGHFAVELHDAESDPAFTLAEYRIYQAGSLVDSGFLDWGSNGNNESHFFGYTVSDQASFFDQVAIVVGDDGAGGGLGERMAADRFTFGTAFADELCITEHVDTFTEGGPSVGLATPNASVSDVDDTTFPTLTIDIDQSTILDAGEEFLTIGGTDFQLDAVANSTTAVSVGGVSYDVDYTAATGELVVTRTDGSEMTAAEVEAVLTDTTYRNDSVLPTESDRIFEVVVNDGDSDSNIATSTITVVRDPEVAAWTLAGPATVIDGNVASNTLSMSAPLRDGETASVDLAFADVDTNSSDYVSFATTMTAAVAAYSGPGSLAWDGTTLTFTSDGTGPMSPLTLPITTTSDSIYEGDEDYSITLSNPASTTGETISIAAGTVTTTITDNNAPPTVTIGDASELEGTPLEFTISLDLASFEDITLNLGLTNGSATVGTDVEATNFEYWDGAAWQPATNGTEVTIPAGATSLLVRIDSVQDGLVEPDETFTLGATVLAGTVTSASDTGIGQIVNDDVGTIAIDDVTVDEDNGTMVFTVSLDQPSASTVTVNYATASDTATSGVDFTAASGVVAFTPGSQSETITINIANDNLFEQSESFDVNLSAASSATIGDALGVGTIIDDGTGPNGTDDDRPVIAVDDVTATEDVDTHAVFTVSLSNPSTQNIVLALALADVTATSSADYGPGLEFFDGTVWQPVVGNVTIAAGATSVQVRTPILDDAIIDAGETYSLTATNVSGITLNASDVGTGTILDDPTPDVTIVEITGPPSVTEGNIATYTVAINNTPITDVTVTFTYSGTASGGTDYSGIASVTIPAGSTNANFDIATIDDTLGEPLENFTVTIASITGGSLEATAISATDNAVTTDIIDDDIPTISINDVVVTEGSDQHAEFTVELSNPTYEDIDFDLTAASGSAIIGDDFGNLTLANLEVFDGTSWVPATTTTVSAGAITIRLRTPINDDVLAEPVETFTVTATVTGGTTLNPSTTGTGTIQDDTIAPETVLVSLVGPATVVEGNTTTNYTLTLEEIPVEDVTVTLVYSGTATDGSDFTGVATVLIPTGSATGTFTLPTVNDSLYEISEDIIITIDSVTGGGFEGIGIDTTADEVTTTITDVADIPTVAVNNVSSVEGTDAFAVYTVEISNLSVEDVDFDLLLTDITALGTGTDYGSAAANNLQVFDGTTWVNATSATIAAGTFSVQVRTPIADDPIDEPNETYSLTVDITGGTTTNAQVVGTGTIIDDDAAPDITIDDAAATEGDPLVFDVSLTNPSSQPIVLDLSPADVTAVTTADYTPTFEYSTDGGTTWITATSGTQVTIPALSTAIQVRAATTEDTTLESTETMSLSIASVVSGTAGNTSDTATGTITDDDTALVSITANDPVAGEPNDNAQFTVSMTNPADSPTVIAYTVSGSATSGVDYAALSGTITLPAGATSGLIDLTVIDDSIVEGLEDVTLTLTSITSGDPQISIDLANDEATATITDDDEVTWQLTGATTVNEGAVAIYNVDLLGELQSGESVSVNLSIANNTTTTSDYADFNTAVASSVAAYSGPGSLSWDGTTLTFTSEGTGAMAQLPIQLLATNDAIVEGPEDYDVSISTAASTTGSTATIDAANNSVNTTIEDTIDAVGTSNDTASWSIVGPTSADEGATAQYTVSLDAALGANETATVDISLTDIDTNSSDYADFIVAVTAAAAANPNVTFSAGTLTYTAPTDGATMTDLVIDLAIINDTIIEGPEDFRIDLAAPGSSTGAVIAVDPLAAGVTTTINDTQGISGAPDGPSEWSITGAALADEGATAQYTVALSGQFGAGEVVTVDLGLTDIDTTSTDYASIVTAITASAAANPDVAFNAATGTLTYTAPSDGASMTDLVVDLGIVDDTIIEGPEDFSLALANATTTTGANVAIDAAAQSVTTTINDTQGIGGAPDGPAEWSITGPAAADEGATAQYTVALSGQFGAGEVVTVDLGLTDIDTTSADYASITAAITAAAAANPDVTFNAATGTLTFTAPSDGATMTDLVVDLAITDDAIIEGPEDFSLALSNATTSTGASVSIDAASDEVTTTINDTQGIGGIPDGPAEWSITGAISVDEGDIAEYTIELSGVFGAGEIATIDVNLTELTTNAADHATLTAALIAAAAANPDVTFNAATGTFTYVAPSDGASMTPLSVDIQITDDVFTEGSEQYNIALSNPGSTSGASIAVSATQDAVTTEINDTQGVGNSADGPAEWSITGPTSADEGATAQYTVALSEQFGVGEVVTVNLGLTDIDTNSSDYASIVTAITAAAAANPDVTFNAATGTLTYTAPSDGASMSDLLIDLAITDDTIIEGPEDFTLALTNAATSTGANVAIDATAIDVTTTINDTQGIGGIPDGPAEWSITGATSADEGAIAQYTVALSGQFGAGEVVTVDLGLTDIDTTSTDYASITAAITASAAANPDVTFNAATGTLTYTAPSDGASLTDLVIDLGIIDDVLIEGPEDFSLALSNATTSSGANVAINATADDVTTTINDTQGPGGVADGPAEWSIAGPASADEGATAQYTVALSGQFGAGEVVTVDLGLTNIDTNSSDYASITAAITASAAANPDVTFNAATGTLTYTAPSDGATMTDLVINLGIVDDVLIEGPEDFSLALSNATTTSGANVAIDAAADDVTTTINDTQGVGGAADGPAEWSITGPTSADEGATAQYTVALSGQFGAGEVVTVDLALTDIDTNSSDYASITAAITAAAAANPDVTYNAASGTLTYTAPNDGASMTDLVIDLGIVDDVLIEGPEDFSISLSNSTTATGAAVGIDAIAQTVTTTINDTQGIGGSPDGPAEWSITGSTAADEGATAQYTVALSGQFGAGEIVTVDLGLTDIDTNSSDYASITAAITAAAAANPDVTFNATTGTLTYTAPSDGATMTDLVIDLGIVDDVLIEGPEDFSLALANATTSTGANVAIDAAADEVTTTINDTQGIGGAPDGPAVWSITGPASADEGATAQYTVALTGQFGAGEVVTVDLGLTDIDTNSADYASITAAIAAAAAANPDVTYNAATGILTYTAPSDGAAMSSLVIDLGIVDDVLIEGPEDFSLALTNATTSSGANVAIDAVADEVTTTINDTQGIGGAPDGPAEWSITGPASADEGATAQYTVALTGQFGAGEVVTVDLGLTDVDTNSSDYASIVSAINAAVAANPDVTYNAATGTLTYTAPSDGAAMTDLVIDFGIVDDVLIEGPEDFSLALTNATTSSGANVAIDAAADDVTTTINDTQGVGGAADGPAEWSITGATSADEGAIAQYTIALSGQFGAGEVVAVDLGLSDIDTNSTDYASIVAAITSAAAANPDVTFNAATGTLTYTAPSDGAAMTDLVIDLGIVDDVLIEGPEDFSLALSNPVTSSGAAVAVDAAAQSITTTINDTQGIGGIPDGPAEWSITGPAAADEGATAQYIVALSGQFGAGEVVSVDLGLTDIDTNSSDYANVVAAISAAAAANPDVTFNAATGTLTYTAPADGASMTDLVIDLGVTDDTLIEGPEDYSLALTNATTSSGASIQIDAAANDVTTTINDTQGIGGAPDGPAEWSITGANSVDEGATAQYTVSLSGQFGGGEVVTVDLGLTDIDTNSSDYASIVAAISAAAAANPDVTFNAVSGTLTYTAPADGASMADLVIDLVATDDTLIEGPEDFSLALSNATTSSGANVAIDAAADVVTTTINDTQGIGGAPDGPAEWSIIGPAAADEGATAQYTVSLSGQFGAGEVVTVDVGLTDIDTNSSDYASIVAAISAAAAANPDVTFNAVSGTLTYTAPADGASMTDVVIDLGIVDDVLIEGPEDYSLALTNATTSTGANIAIDVAADVVTTTINDTQGIGGISDGPAEWSIIGPAAADEAATAQYTVSLTGQFGAGEVVTVDLGLSDIDTNSTDYASIVAAITASVATNPDVMFNAATGTLTYTAPTDGASMTDLVIDLGIVDDVLIEGPEDFSLSLSNATTSSGANIAIDVTADVVTTTINDTQGIGGAADGPAEWSIIGPTSVDEGANAQYTIALSGQFGAGEVVTVDLGLTDIDTNSSDYANIVAAIAATASANPDVTFNATTGTLTYTAPVDGASMADLVIDLGIVDDVLLEGPEDYRLALSNPATSTGAAVGVAATADDVTTTINDTQGPGGPVEGPATWSITGTPEIGEGNSATYTVSLTGQFQGGEVVTVDLGLTDNSTDGADYGSLFSEIAAVVASDPDLAFDTVTGTLTYTAPADGASMSPLVFDLPITDDTNVESPEDYDIVLSNSTSPTGVANTIDPAATSANTIINGDPFVSDDIQHTTVGTPVSDNVLTNDSDPDGDPLTVTTTPVVPPANGTLVLAANGAYTYTPNPGFRGVDSFDYEVCDDFGNCEVATVTIMIADLSASKSQVSVTQNGDNFDVGFVLSVENTGSTRMDNLSLIDDIANQFGATFLSVSSPVLDALGVVGGVAPTLNSAWSANTALDLLDPSATNEFLLPGDAFSISFVATIDPDATGAATTLTNLATIAGDDITTIPGSPLSVTDDSDAGSDPSTTNPGTPGDSGGEDDPTPLFVPDVRIAKQQVGTPVELPDRSWNVDFEIFVENTGTTDLAGVSLLDDSAAQLGSVWHGSSNLAIDPTGVSLGGVAPLLNSGWLSDPSQDMLDGSGVLRPGEFFRVTFTLNLDPDDTPSGFAEPMTNQATAAGVADDGSGPVVVGDDSDSGADANTTNSGAPGDAGTSSDPTPIEISEIGAAKRIVNSVPIASSPGHVAMTYEIRVRNLATNDLTNLSIQDDLATNLGPAFQGVLSSPTLISSTASIDPNLNLNFDGTSDIGLFDGASGLLRAGEEIVVQFSLEVQVDLLTSTSINQVLAGASDGGAGVTDLSDSGSDPAGSNPNTTGDTGGEDDPTLPPAIGIAKDHGTPIEVGEHWLVPIEIFVRNLGLTDLVGISVVDDVISAFGAAFVSASTPVIDSTGVVGGTGPSINAAWTNDTSSNLLDGNGLLTANDEFTVSFDVVVDPDATGTSQYLFNQAIVTAGDPANPGLEIVDTSDSGSDPSSSNVGEPGDTGLTDDFTPLEIADIGLAKALTLVRQSGASFVLNISLFLENTGTVDITNLSLIDDVVAEFAPHSVSVVSAPQFVSSNATINPNFNAGFVGDPSQDIFDLSSGLLAPGEGFVVELDVLVSPDYAASVDGGIVLTNQATAGGAGVGATGAILSVVSDASDSGTNPNSNNGGGGFGDPTPISIGVFAFDSFNNFSNPFEPKLTMTSAVPVPVLTPVLSTTYTGVADPGTTLSFRSYGQAGQYFGSQTAVADAAGNWLVSISPVVDVYHPSILQLRSFGNASSSHVFEGHTLGHRVEVAQTPVLYSSTASRAGQVYFQSAMRPPSYFSTGTTIDKVLIDSPSESLRAMHQMNYNPLQMGLDTNGIENRVRSISW